MESHDESPPHDPNDPRGGGGFGGPLDPEGQRRWKEWEESRKKSGGGETRDDAAEPEPEEPPGPFEGDVRAF